MRAVLAFVALSSAFVASTARCDDYTAPPIVATPAGADSMVPVSRGFVVQGDAALLSLDTLQRWTEWRRMATFRLFDRQWADGALERRKCSADLTYASARFDGEHAAHVSDVAGLSKQLDAATTRSATTQAQLDSVWVKWGPTMGFFAGILTTTLVIMAVEEVRR